MCLKYAVLFVLKALTTPINRLNTVRNQKPTKDLEPTDWQVQPHTPEQATTNVHPRLK